MTCFSARLPVGWYLNKTEWLPMVTRGDLNDPTSGVEHPFGDLVSYILTVLLGLVQNLKLLVSYTYCLHGF